MADYSRYDPVLPQGHPFINVTTAYYWSSNTCSPATTHVWAIGMGPGDVFRIDKWGRSNALPVRMGQIGSFDYPVIWLSPTSHNFGSVPLENSSAQTFEISNKGKADLEIDLITITGTNVSEFIQQ